MNSDKLIASLCYFSIFFAGFILPIAVYFIVPNPEVKKHALHALLSHIVPVATIIFVVVPFFFFWSIEAFAAVTILILGLLVIVNIGVVVWNVIMGIKVLAQD